VAAVESPVTEAVSFDQTRLSLLTEWLSISSEISFFQLLQSHWSPTSSRFVHL
jgi:hypothetical protein